MRYWRWILAGVVLGSALFGVAVLSKEARHDRQWVSHLAATPSAAWDQTGEMVTISPIRDWQYLPLREGIAILEVFRQQGTYDLSALQDVWFILEPHPGMPIMAHTLVVFDFGPLEDGGAGMVGVTIEARKVDGERYSPLLGTFNKYELVYVWAEPRDLLSRRATLLNHDLEAYRLDLTPEQKRRFFRRLVERTQSIARRPRFYNTLGSNCTNELAKAADLSWDTAFIFTGGAAKTLHKHGLIAGDDFDALRSKASIADKIRGRNWRHEAFNAMLRRHNQSSAS